MESAEQEAGLEAALRTSEKRRLAAEQVTLRTRADLVSLAEGLDSRESEIDVLRADLTKADDLLSEMKAEIIDVRNEARHARDRESAAVTKLQAAMAELEQVRRSSEQDEPLVPESAPNNESEIANAVQTARDLADQLASLLPDSSHMWVERLRCSEAETTDGVPG